MGFGTVSIFRRAFLATIILRGRASCVLGAGVRPAFSDDGRPGSVSSGDNVTIFEYMGGQVPSDRGVT